MLFLAAMISGCAVSKEAKYSKDLPAEFTLKCGDCRDLK